jgi:microcystin-dependent protein
MPRNGFGTMSIVNTATANAVITSSDYNENFADVADEITNSLALDGQSTMTGQLRAANGTAAAPAVTFGSDSDTGPYRSAADEYSIATGGSQRTATSSAGFDVKSGNYLKGGAIVGPTPIGGVIDFAGTAAPAGWLMCGGQAVSRTTYALLFAVLGTQYGSGDGSTTFNVPDLRGRVSAGKGDMAGSDAARLTATHFGSSGTGLGNSGGSEGQAMTIANLPAFTPSGSVSGSVTFTPSGSVSGNLNNYTPAGSVSGTVTFTPSGSVSINDPGHAHNIPSYTGAGVDSAASGVGEQAPVDFNNNRDTDIQTTGISASFSGVQISPSISASFSGTQSSHVISASFSGVQISPSISASFSGTPVGSGTAHNNVQPTLILNKIIFAGA